MADLDVTKKHHVYHLLHRLNLNFAGIVRRCRELQETRVFRREFLRVFEGFAQELQAEINFELLETLHELESHDWYRYGKVRNKWEKELRDPDDVFIDAERRRQELARHGKKPPHVWRRPISGRLDRRYDEVKSGKVQPVVGEGAFRRLRAKSKERRR